MKNFTKFRLGFLTILSLVVTIALCFAVGTADDTTVLSAIGNFGSLMAIATAVLGGLTLAKHEVKQHSATSNPKAKKSITSAVLYFLLAGVIAWWVIGSLDATSLMWIPVAFFGALGVLAVMYRGQAGPTWARRVLVLGGFLGGIIPGVILYFILSIAVSERYCQISGSKCM